MGADRGRRPGAALPGRTAGESHGDLPPSIAERHRPLPRRARRPRVLAARGGTESRDRRPGRPARAARVLCDGSLCNSAHLAADRCTAHRPFIMLAPRLPLRRRPAMNATTTKALSLALVVAVWTIVSHLGKLQLQLWPVIVGVACFLCAGGGMMGLQKSILRSLSGVVWALVYGSVAGALGHSGV